MWVQHRYYYCCAAVEHKVNVLVRGSGLLYLNHDCAGEHYLFRVSHEIDDQARRFDSQNVNERMYFW